MTDNRQMSGNLCDIRDITFLHKTRFEVFYGKRQDFHMIVNVVESSI